MHILPYGFVYFSSPSIISALQNQAFAKCSLNTRVFYSLSLILIFGLFRYCDGGELFQYIIEKKYLSEDVAAFIMK